MLCKALTFLFTIVAFTAKAQIDPSEIPPISKVNFKIDTNKLVEDENGKLLHYYQYHNLLSSGEYGMKFKGDPRSPDSKPYLAKTTIEQSKAFYETLKPTMPINNTLLR